MIRNLSIVLPLLFATFFCSSLCAQSNECAGATLVPTSADVSTPTLITLLSNTYTASPEAKSSCSYSKNKDVWFRFVATSTIQVIKMYDATISDPDVYSYSLSGALYEGVCGSLVELGCGRSGSLASGTQFVPKDFMFSASGLTVGATYYLRINADASTNFSGSWYWADTIRFKLSVLDVTEPDNDECAGAVALTRSRLDITNFHATQSMAPMSSCIGFPTGTSGKDLWFTFRSSTDGLAEIELDQSDIDVVAQVFSGSCGSLTSVGCADISDTLKFTASYGQEYFVRVYGYHASDTGAFGIRLLGEGALPVKIQYFDAVALDRYNKISWKAAYGEGVKEYRIQYSINGFDFRDIGALTATKNTGVEDYIFMHEAARHGTYYYRLKVVNEGDVYDYTDIVKVDRAAGSSLILDLFPNPSENVVTIKFNPVTAKNISVRLQNVFGQTLEMWPALSDPELKISLSGYPKGIYMIQCHANGSYQSKKILKQ